MQDHTENHWRHAFSTDEIKSLLAVSNLHGVWMVASNWLLIGGALAAAARWPNPLTFAVALLLIGGRQLGFAIVMHEASHRTLFTNRRLNDWVGNWFAAYWVFLSVELYRPYHLQHHAHTGTERDPDLPLKRGFPTTPASMMRKVLRDMFGIIGVKRLIGTATFLVRAARGNHGERAAAAVFLGNESVDASEARRALVGFAVTQAALLGVLWALGHPQLFALWAVAWLTTQNLVTRIRSIAEHSMTPATGDPFRNTRTVLANPLERLFIAPNRVNYHLEHHLLMTVPHHRLPEFHERLRQRGLLESAHVAPGYGHVLRAAAGK